MGIVSFALVVIRFAFAAIGLLAACLYGVCSYADRKLNKKVGLVK